MEDPAQEVAEQLARACAWGCAVASLMIEEVGVPSTPMRGLRPRALQRHAELLPRCCAWVLRPEGGDGSAVEAGGRAALRPPTAASAVRQQQGAGAACAGGVRFRAAGRGGARLPASGRRGARLAPRALQVEAGGGRWLGGGRCCAVLR